MGKEIIVVSFSGGKTSAFMCHWLLENFSDKYDFIFIFANTGREHEETLKFVDACDKAFRLNLVWVEADVSPIKGIGIRHKIVDFKSASRNGEPFERVIAKEGIPNVSRAFCTERLKTRVIRDWMKSNGLIKKGWQAKTAVGMRADEPSRADMNKQSVKKYNLVYPLAHWSEPGFDKQDVNDFWEDMPFKLNIPERYGNCLTCFKKSDNKLMLIAQEHPEWFRWNVAMENNYKHVNAKPEHGNEHRWWRKRRDTRALLEESALMDPAMLIMLTKTEPDNPNGCGNECRPFGDEE